MITDAVCATEREECNTITCGEGSCQHDGLCVPMGHGIQCFCPAGFTGRSCETDIDKCS